MRLAIDDDHSLCFCNKKYLAINFRRRCDKHQLNPVAPEHSLNSLRDPIVQYEGIKQMREKESAEVGSIALSHNNGLFYAIIFARLLLRFLFFHFIHGNCVVLSVGRRLISG